MEMVNSNGEAEAGKDEVILLTRDGSIWSKARWFWLRRTGLERVLIALLVIALLALVLVIIFGLIRDERGEMSTTGYIDGTTGDIPCMEDSCVSIVSELIPNMNLLVDPCDDFYEYSCGNWLRHHSPPKVLEDGGRIGVQNVIAKEVAKVSEDLLSRDSSSLRSDEAFWKAKMFYKSCMNKEQISREGAQRVLELWDVFGGFHTEDVPCPEDESEDDAVESLTEVLANLMFASDEPLLVRVLLRNRSILIGQPPSQVRYPTVPKLSNEEEFIFETMKVIYPNGSLETMSRLAANISDLWIQIQDACTSNMTKRNVTIAELNNILPQINWVTLFKSLFPQDSYDISIIELFYQDYFDRLGVVFSQTPTRLVKEYFMWHVLRYVLKYAEGPLREISNRYQQTSFVSEKERGKYCTENTLRFFQDTVAAIFIEERFDVKILKQATEMFKNIKATYLGKIAADSDVEYRPNITEIVNSTKIHLAPPERMYQRHLLDEHYKDVQIGNDFLSNVLVITKHFTRNYIFEWSSMPYEIVYPRFSPSYSTVGAAVMIPFGSFLRPSLAYYDSRTLFYSSVGFSMAHELTHSMDNLEYIKFQQILKDRLHCLLSSMEKDIDSNSDVRQSDIAEYSKEARADLAGLEVAYQTFLNQHEDVTLSYLNLNANQTFFINFAQMMCGHMTDAQIRRDRHPPDKYRVITSLRNFAGFAEAFNCPRDSPMNPSKKCKMWH